MLFSLFWDSVSNTSNLNKGRPLGIPPGPKRHHFNIFSTIIYYIFSSFQEVAEAIELAAQAIEIKQNNYDGYYARAKALMEFGNYGDALKDAKSALEKSHSTPTPADIRDTLTRLHEDLYKKNNSFLSAATTRSNSVHSARSIAESMDIITDL